MRADGNWQRRSPSCCERSARRSTRVSLGSSFSSEIESRATSTSPRPRPGPTGSLPLLRARRLSSAQTPQPFARGASSVREGRDRLRGAGERSRREGRSGREVPLEGGVGRAQHEEHRLRHRRKRLTRFSSDRRSRIGATRVQECPERREPAIAASGSLYWIEIRSLSPSAVNVVAFRQPAPATFVSGDCQPITPSNS
jgi:hypothetical protein